MILVSLNLETPLFILRNWFPFQTQFFTVFGFQIKYQKI